MCPRWTRPGDCTSGGDNPCRKSIPGWPRWPAGEVKQLVGHSQDMDTFGIYGHTLTGDDETTAQAVNGVFLRVLKNAQ